MSEGTQKQQPTVFILYIPGGAMLGLIPALTLARIEALTETPVPELFQVVEGVSTGSILAAGFSVPGMTAKRSAELYAQRGPVFFPEIPGRWKKMHARQGINTGKIYFGLNPEFDDQVPIHDIEKLCGRMRTVTGLTSEDMADLIDQLEANATKEWFTSATHKRVLKIAAQINALEPEMEKYTEALAELVTTRTYSNRISAIFKSAAQGSIDTFRDWFAPKDKVLFDSKTPEAVFKELYGDRKVSESICSTYISAYDVVNNSIITFSSLKDDLFSKDPDQPATTSNDLKLWDAVMASTANELAFKSHITENNLLCSDKAIFHKPRAVRDVLSKVPKGTKVVLVMAGTGRFISKDLEEFLENEEEHENEQQSHASYRQKLERMRDERAELGVSGNLIMGSELSELESYISSDAKEDFINTLGAENVIDLSPRLAPHNDEEIEKFPSRDVLDASRENIRKIIWRSRKFCQEEDQQIRQLSQMLVDNLYMMGKMDNQKYARVCTRIGLKTHDIESEVEKDSKGLENRIPSNDNSTPLQKAWRRLSKRIFGDDSAPRVSGRRPKEPKDPPNNNPPPPNAPPGNNGP